MVIFMVRGYSLGMHYYGLIINTERSMGKGHPVTTRACSIKEKSKSGLMKPRRGACPCDWNPSLGASVLIKIGGQVL